MSDDCFAEGTEVKYRGAGPPESMTLIETVPMSIEIPFTGDIVYLHDDESIAERLDRREREKAVAFLTGIQTRITEGDIEIGQTSDDEGIESAAQLFQYALDGLIEAYGVKEDSTQ